MTDSSLAARVEAMIRRLQKEDVNMHGFLLSVNGQEKIRAAYTPFREDQPHRMYSVSKTMTGLAVGILADEGKLSLDDRITGFFPDWLPPDPDPYLMQMTVRHMLMMATCYPKTTYREGVDENWAKTFFRSPAAHAPGMVFHYDTSCSQVLAALVRRLSGQEVMDFLEERLFTPLGCEDHRYWLKDPSGCCQGGTGLYLSLRDFHRVGQCLLDGGLGLLPAWFVREMQQKHIDTCLQANREERYGYGWQCWRTRAGWAMYGMGGQLGVLCPEKQALLSTVVDTRLDPDGVQRIYDAFFEEVYPYIGLEDTDPVCFRPDAQALPDRAEFAVPETPVYRFRRGNPLGLLSLNLNGDCLTYENDRGQVYLPFGRGRVKEISFPGFPDVPALASGGWLEKGLLRVRCHAIPAPCGFDMLLRFTEETVTIKSVRSTDPVTEGYEGSATGQVEDQSAS